MTTTTTDVDSREAVIRRLAAETHVTVSYRGGVVTVAARFPGGDDLAYMHAEAACQEVLAEFRMVYPGTIWGADGIAGLHAKADGLIELHMSGVEKRLGARFLRVAGLPETTPEQTARDRARDRASLMGKAAIDLIDAAIELDNLDGAKADGYLVRLAETALEYAVELDQAERAGDRALAGQARRDMARLMPRVRRLVELA